MASTAIYARISKDRHEGLGVERQLELGRRFAERQGWTELWEFTDNDISASRFSRKARPAFDSLRAAIRSRQVERVIFWSVDRMYRRPMEQEEMFSLLDAVQAVGDGVRLYSTETGELPADSTGRWLQRLLVANAAREAEQTSERLRAQRAQARELGHAHGGVRPFGYRWQDRRLVVDPAEAALVRSAAEHVLAGGSIHALARQWRAAGHATVRGGVWREGTIRQILTAPRYAGLLRHRGEVFGAASWQPILGRQLWDRLQVALGARSWTRSQPARRTLLTGLLRCGGCGASLISMTVKSRKGETVRQRACVRRQDGTGCAKVYVNEKRAVEEIERRLLVYMDQLDLAEMIARLRADDGTKDDAAELVTLTARRDETRELVASGTMPPADGAAILQRLDTAISGLRERLARSAEVSPLEPFAGRPGALRAAWTASADAGGLTVDEKRAILAAAFGQIVVNRSERRGSFDPDRVVCAPRELAA